MNRAIEIKAPKNYSETRSKLKVFLAGSIEMGVAIDWQTKLINELKEEDITFLNPRRDSWDSSWEQSIDNPQFKEQVLWELTGQDDVDVIFIYFDPSTKSPITLLELGLYANSGKMIVCCPDGFWRKGNVDIVCEKYNIPCVKTIGEAIDVLYLHLD